MHLFIDTGNAAFSGDDRPLEVSRILTELSEELRDHDRIECQSQRVLHDYNGNSVGYLNQGGLPAESQPGRIVLSFDTGNAAFSEPNFGAEVSKIFKEAADKLSGGSQAFCLRDTNGNIVGEVKDMAAEPSDFDSPVN